MVKLTVKKPDDSIYFVGKFQSSELANKWLSTEQKRFYWSKDFTYRIEDLSSDLAAKASAAQAAFNANAAAKASAVAKIKTALSLTDDEAAALLR